MPEVTAAPQSSRDLYLAVAIGGAIGASARYALGLIVPTSGDQWPLATFMVNLSGAFILGVILALADAYFPNPPASTTARRFRPFVITGILGGYTTFSTFMVETHGLATAGEVGKAIAYLVSSILLGILLCLFGIYVGSAYARAVGRAPTIKDSVVEAVEDVTDEDEA